MSINEIARIVRLWLQEFGSSLHGKIDAALNYPIPWHEVAVSISGLFVLWAVLAMIFAKR